MEVQTNIDPSYSKKIGALKAERTVKRTTFERTEANPGETLYVYVPKLNANQVLVPGSLALVFDISLDGGDANNYVVQNVSRALVERLVVKFAGTTLQDTVGYDVYKIWEDLFLSKEERDNMLEEGIQSTTLSKIRSNAGDKATSGVDAENALTEVFGTKYRIRLDHQILKDHGVVYPQALYNDFVFEITLAPASQVVMGSDTTKLKYKLTNIQREYETIQSKYLADEASSLYTTGKTFTFDHIIRDQVVSIAKATDTKVNMRINPQRRSLKGILLLFVEPYTAGARDPEKFFNPGITKVCVTVNGSPNMVFNNGLEGRDVWREVERFFGTSGKTAYMNMKKFYSENKYGLLVDLRTMSSHDLYGSGRRLVNTKDGVQLEIERKGSGSGNVNCHVFVISDALMNILGRQLDSVEY